MFGLHRSMKLNYFLSTNLAIMFLIASICVVLFMNHTQRKHALGDARSKAMLILNRNIATHTYFTHQLKPSIFKQLDDNVSKNYFEPRWMSSTYAVKQIDKYFKELSPSNYYYREFAVNARNPENEADEYEKALINELNSNPQLQERSLVRVLDGRPYYVVLRRGETLDKSCLRCHGDPANAPGDMVGLYGNQRGFYRTVGETVSAISIRIPLADAFADADRFSLELSVFLFGVLVCLFAFQHLCNNRYLYKPLAAIRGKAIEISCSEEHLGEEIPLPSGNELRGLAEAFNSMSTNLRRSRDQLEERIKERTRELEETNQRLIQEADHRKRAEGSQKESERRFQEMLENVKLVAVILDNQGNIVFCNDALLNLTGWEKAEAVGCNWFKTFIPEQIRGEMERFYFQGVMSGDYPLYFENEILTRNGERRLIGWNNGIFKDLEGRVIGGSSIGEDITERRSAEIAVQRERDQAQRYLDIAGVMITILDDKGRITRINKEGCEILGWEEREIIGVDWFECCLPDSIRSEVRDAFDKLMAGEWEPFEYYSNAVLTRDGQERMVAFYNTLLREDDGRITGVLCSGKDITDSLQLEGQRKTITEILNAINLSTDLPVLIKNVTRILKEWLGCDAIGIRLRDGLDYPYFETSGFTDEFVLAESSLCLTDGNGAIVLDESGEPLLECMCGNIISGRFDPSKPFFTERGSFVSNGTTELLATTTEVDRQARTRNRCNGEGYESVALIPLKSQGKIYGLLQINDKRKGFFSSDLIAFLEGLADNLAIAFAQRLAEAERVRLVAAIERAGEGFLLLDKHRRIQYMNSVMETLTGYGRGELINKDVSVMRSGKESQTFYDSLWETVSSGAVWRGLIHNRKKDGSILESETTISQVGGSSGQVESYVLIKRDVSVIRKLERQLRQAQKMEAIGTLAGGIAHDFNNILGPILGYAEMGMMSVPEDSQLQRDLKEIFKAGHRAKELVKQILAFSRQKEQETRPVPVTLIVKEAVKLLRASIPSTIEIRQEISDEVSNARVLGDATQIHQVLMNLCTNSAYAMREKGGTLEVRMKKIALESDSDMAYQGLKPGAYVRLTVSDTGHGMTEAIRQRIFEPYFTTKPQAEGTGLGLAMVYSIVKNLGGEVTVYSELDQGSVFNVFLPVIESVSDASAPAPAPLPTGRGLILLVDDEPAMLDMVKKMLERLGYEVLSQPSGIDALRVFRERPRDFDLVVTDQTMPKMTGATLARNLLEIRRDLPIILCTGFSEIINGEQARELGIRGFLLKPVEMRALAETIRDLLGNKPGVPTA